MKREQDPGPRQFRLERRQFLANLLFGGALTLSGLQSAQAQQNPTDGWSIPDLNKPDKVPTPTPSPPPTAGVPIPPGRVTPPPNPKGRVVLPPDGDVCPPKPGERIAPPPPPEKRSE